MMPAPSPLNRATLRACTPERYLRDGWFAANGALPAELTGWWATAAAEQLLAGQVAPHEVETTLAAFLQMRPYYQDRDAFDAAAMTTECLRIVEGVLGQPNNPALVAWLEPCVSAIQEWRDLNAFMTHLRAVVLQYTILVANSPPSHDAA